MDFNKQNIILTGATGGIGQAFAKALIYKGAKLLLVGRNEEKLQCLVKALSKCDSAPNLLQLPQYCVCDISLSKDRKKLLAYADDFGATMLINSAGVNQFGAFVNHVKGFKKEQDIEPLMQINLIAPMALCQQFLSNRNQRHPRTIVNIGSAFGSIGFPYYVNYCASKFALRGFSEALHREVSESGDKVFYFAPRATQTSMNSEAVCRMNNELGNHVDAPYVVANALVNKLQQGRIRHSIGWPESFFAKLNALFPNLVDKALMKKAKIMKSFIKPALPHCDASSISFVESTMTINKTNKSV